MPDELAPPTFAHRIEFRVCWWVGTAFEIAAGWLCHGGPTSKGAPQSGSHRDKRAVSGVIALQRSPNR